MAAELRAMYEADPDVRRVIDVARGLEGLRRQDGIHAAAVVITKEPLTEYLPIQRKPESGQDPEAAPVVTQYEMHGVEDLGLLKMDFLGLRNLDVITDTLDVIRAHPGRRASTSTPSPSTTPPTYELLGRGDTIGRVPARVARPCGRCMRALAPTSFEDVSALIALYRPGPMSVNMHYDYADRKNGRKPVEYFHPDAGRGARRHLRADDLPGVGDAGGAALRRLLAGRGRQPAQGVRQEDPRADGQGAGEVRGRVSRRTGYGRALGKELFDVIERFADYAFNKSHSFGYGLVTYQTAYLKANYPVEYLASLLTSVKTNLDKAGIYLNECRQLGIQVLLPDVNRSESDFVPTPDGKGIYFGLSAVRNVGEGLVELLLAERDRAGPVRRLLRLLRPGRREGAEQADGRVADQGRGLRRHGPPPPGPARRLRADHRRRPSPAAGSTRWASRRCSACSATGPSPPSSERVPIPDAGLRQAPEAGLREGDAGPLRLRPPADGGRAVPRPADRLLAGRPRREGGRQPGGRRAAWSPAWCASGRSGAT